MQSQALHFTSSPQRLFFCFSHDLDDHGRTLDYSARDRGKGTQISHPLRAGRGIRTAVQGRLVKRADSVRTAELSGSPDSRWPEGIARLDRPQGAIASLLFYGGDAGVVVLPHHFSPERCARWVSGVYESRNEWTSDFGGEQFTLGRAFYTHYEEGKSEAYFADVASSDALVETHAPLLQDAMRDLVAQVTEGRIVQRRGWCGP